MKILCTFPGRYGDLIWSLSVIRALHRLVRVPIDLMIAGEFRSILLLLEHQPYVGAVYAHEDWPLHPGWREPPAGPWMTAGYDYVLHLGYRGWPQRPLPFETLDCLNEQIVVQGTEFRDIGNSFLTADLDLQTPWITVDGPGVPCEVAVGFTEAWFELKLGLMVSLHRHWYGSREFLQLTPPGSRWTHEVPPGCLAVLATADWIVIARAIRDSDLFLGDCSALHVLAVALGKRVVLCEPMEARHNQIFYPLGWDGPQVRIVKGGDGQPTFDARHCADTLREVVS